MKADPIIFGVMTFAPPPDLRRPFETHDGEFYYIGVVHRRHLAIQDYEKNFLLGCISADDAIELGRALIEEGQALKDIVDGGAKG